MAMPKIEGSPGLNQEKNSLPSRKNRLTNLGKGAKRWLGKTAAPFALSLLAACGAPDVRAVGGNLPIPTVAGDSSEVNAQNTAIAGANTTSAANEATAQAGGKIPPEGTQIPKETPTPEVAQQVQCSIFKNSKFCGLVEVFEGVNPRAGKFKGVGIKAPENPLEIIEIVSPIDGYIQPILNNPLRANISTDKNTTVGGWFVGGVEFYPTGRADTTPVKKGQVIGILKDNGYRPLSYAQDYIAYFGPSDLKNEDALIERDFASSASLRPRKVDFQSSGIKYEQGPVIINP